MSSRTWTPRAVASEAAPLRLDLWRAVEAQHVVATDFRLENLKTEIGTGIALCVDLEHMVRLIDGRSNPRALRVTQACRFENDAWRIFHRHADEFRASGR